MTNEKYYCSNCKKEMDAYNGEIFKFCSSCWRVLARSKEEKTTERKYQNALRVLSNCGIVLNRVRGELRCIESCIEIGSDLHLLMAQVENTFEEIKDFLKDI